jgi:hypothetical protein
MRRGILILILALLLAAAVFCVYRHFAGREALVIFTHENAELEWFRREFDLNEEEFSRIAALHWKYGRKCDALCAKVVEANTKLEAAIVANRRMTPAVTAALRDAFEVEYQCRLALLDHIYSVCSEMKPGAAKRYRDMMMPRIVLSAERHHRMVTSERH